MLSVCKLYQEGVDEVYRLLDTKKEESRLKRGAKIILHPMDGYTVQEIQRKFELESLYGAKVDSSVQRSRSGGIIR